MKIICTNLAIEQGTGIVRVQEIAQYLAILIFEKWRLKPALKMGVFTKIREHDKKGFLSHGSYPHLLLIASVLLYHLVTAKAASTEAASPNYRKWRSVQDALFKV